MQVTRRQLEVFEAVARLKSFTKAARELGLSQPAASMQLKQLEAAVGLPLLEQIGREIYLTDGGKAIQRLARSVADCHLEAEQEIEALKGLEGGRLRVSVTTTVNYFASSLLPQFCRTHKGVRVTLDVTNRSALVEQLTTNEVDVVLMGQPPAGLDVEAVAFRDNPLVVIAASQHPLGTRSRIPLSALSQETFLMREPGSGTRTSVEQYFLRRNFVPSTTIEMSSNEAIKHSVEVGLGIGIVSIHTIQLELEARRLTILDVRDFPIRRRWYCVHRRGRKLSAAAKAFEASVLSSSATSPTEI